MQGRQVPTVGLPGQQCPLLNEVLPRRWQNNTPSADGDSMGHTMPMMKVCSPHSAYAWQAQLTGSEPRVRATTC